MLLLSLKHQNPIYLLQLDWSWWVETILAVMLSKQDTELTQPLYCWVCLSFQVTHTRKVVKITKKSAHKMPTARTMPLASAATVTPNSSEMGCTVCLKVRGTGVAGMPSCLSICSCCYDTDFWSLWLHCLNQHTVSLQVHSISNRNTFDLISCLKNNQEWCLLFKVDRRKVK